MQANRNKRCAIGYHANIITKVQHTLDQNGIDHVFLSTADYQVPVSDPEQVHANTVFVLPHCDHVPVQSARYFEEKARLYGNHHVIILTAVQNIEKDYPHLPKNISFVHIGGDMLFQQDFYPLVQPQTKKNPDMRRFWISLSHAPRLHRMLTACCLLGHDLGFDHLHQPETGLLRIAPAYIKENANGPAEFVELAKLDHWRQCYTNHSSLDSHQMQIMQKGFELLRQGKNGGQPGAKDYAEVDQHNLNALGGSDNALNFTKYLAELYSNSLVELVNETTYFNQAIFVTEKFLNSVYGFNLPIVFATAGTVDYLRGHGFDMCDHVIDHSYDTIQDPLQRMFAAIQLNIELLTNRDWAWQAWQRSLPRLRANYEFARDRMYDHFSQAVDQQLQVLVAKINS